MQKKYHSVLCGFALCICAVALAVLCACAVQNTGSTPQPGTQPATQPPTQDPIAEQLEKMTLTEKVGQLVTAGCDGYEVDEDLNRLITRKGIGGVILFSDNIESAPQLTALTNQIKQAAQDGIPVLIGMDEEGGSVSRLPEDVLSMPPAYTVAQNGGPDACYEGGKNIARQLTAFGLQTGFSPVLDIWSNPDNTVIGNRAYGTDAQSVASCGIAAMNGVLDGGGIPVVKHFPGHGDTDTDSHYDLPVVTKTKRQLYKSELIPFKQAISQGAPAVMVSHILCSELDEEYPASLSKTLVQGLLRNEMGFDGVVFTDDLTMGAITESYSLEQACVLAVNAGCDMLLVCHEYDNVYTVLEALETAAESGKISMQRIDEAVARILRLKSDYTVTSDFISLPNVTALNSATQVFWDEKR